jgi:hypothetical protein
MEILNLPLLSFAHKHASEPNAATQDHTPIATAGGAVTANSTDPNVVFRSKGMPMAVMYSVSSSPQACQGFERVGRVFDSGRGVLLPWIANLSEKANKRIGRTEVSRSGRYRPASRSR